MCFSHVLSKRSEYPCQWKMSVLSFNTLENLFWLVTVGHVCAVWIGVKIMSLDQQNAENLKGFANFPDALWCLSF